jgi:two-component system chemotaxis response regulator CheB
VEKARKEDFGKVDKKTRVVVIDDSSFMRKTLTSILESDQTIEVVGHGKNGLDGIDKIKELKPDVITLDIDMPVMDGMTALKHVLIENPVPIVVVSSMTNNGEVTFNTLRLGVVDFIPKPSGSISVDMETQKAHLLERVKMAASVTMDNIKRVKVQTHDRKASDAGSQVFSPKSIVTLGASSGEHLSTIRILSHLPEDFPATVIVMFDVSSNIISSFSECINRFSKLPVAEISTPRELKKGHCYITSTDRSIKLLQDDLGRVLIESAHQIDYPIDNMFYEAVEIYNEHVIGILLRGAGKDGIEGLAEIKRNYGTTIISDTSCSLYNCQTSYAKDSDIADMIDRDIADMVLSCSEIADKLSEIVSQWVVVG